ncbi:MAG: hypothetical protein ACD_71C00161G0003 [uncultured bacterium (gcode 4)]|uniref:Uncharacterized protein n=1 Tax=uncultured bacterium (gcode 4) TaxID=1234023 RepID=K1ZIV7_9BACT|nr:MAG: hypothetical protein ACD_71C00161G0003 [uncultured bacterium (gcode 4)]
MYIIHLLYNIMSKKKQALILAPEQQNMIDKLNDPSYVREELMGLAVLACSPDVQYKKWAEVLKKVISWGNFSDDDSKIISQVADGTNITNTHRFLAEIPRDERDKTAMIEFTQDLIDEYDCKTKLEQSLCEVIASSYFSIMKAMSYMQNIYNITHLSNEKNGYYSLISKELEKQNRLYLNALMTLRAIKSPFGNISIKTKTAIIGTNQQFNTNLPPDEIIAD